MAESFTLASTIITVHTSLLFDSKQKRFVRDLSLSVDPETGLITKVYQRDKLLPKENVSEDSPFIATTIDLRGLTVLPGLVDAHTHIFLHPYKDTPPLHQMRDESPVERIVRATNHARTALQSGYTTYRDLGTEGLGDADIGLRDAVNRGLVPGPRMFVATEAIASSAGYEIRHESGGSASGILNLTSVPRISDPADGVDGVRAAVRRRLGAGADVVKFYADYRKRARRFPKPTWPGSRDVMFPPPDEGYLGGGRNPRLLLFGQDEMDALVAEARMARAPVAAHAQTAEAVVMAARAGVTTVEHGDVPSEEALVAMRENDVIFVPTLAVFEAVMLGGSGAGAGAEEAERAFGRILDHTKAAYDKGVRLACGGDTGAFAHGDNVRELELMIRAGVPLEDVLQAATLRGWESCGGDLCGRRFGSLEKGWAADIVALDGDVREELGALRRVNFVMKDGRVHRDGGRSTVS